MVLKQLMICAAASLALVSASARATTTDPAPGATGAAGGSAVTSTGSDQSTAAKPPVAADPMVCKDYPPPTGSRLGGRHVCKKQSQWADAQERARLMMENHQQGMQSSGCTSGPMC